MDKNSLELRLNQNIMIHEPKPWSLLRTRKCYDNSKELIVFKNCYMYTLRIQIIYPENDIRSLLQWFIHTTKGHTLDHDKLLNAVLAAFTTEAALLDTAKPD